MINCRLIISGKNGKNSKLEEQFVLLRARQDILPVGVVFK